MVFLDVNKRHEMGSEHTLIWILPSTTAVAIAIAIEANNHTN